MADPIKGFLDDPIATLKKGSPDNGQRVPGTTVRTSFSLTLHATVYDAAKGIVRRGVIGAVSEIVPRQQMKVDEEYELDRFGRGLPRELVPQNLTNRSLTLRRYDLYTKNIEQIFNGNALVMLIDQRTPISLRMTWRDPNPSLVGQIANPETYTAATQVYEFSDAYITDLGRTISTNNVIVGADATLIWRKLTRLQ